MVSSTTKVVSARVPNEVYDRIEELAWEHQCKINDVVKELLVKALGMVVY